MNIDYFATRDPFVIELLIEALEDMQSNLEANEHDDHESIHIYTLTVIGELLKHLKGE